MSDIGNIGSSITSGLGATGVRAPGDAISRRAAQSTIIESRGSSADRVEVSEVARWLEQMNQLPAVREDKVAAARAAIANGSMDTDEKLSIALSRMIDEIG